MGAALTATGRDITYSCSWPAYVGDNETTKPFATYIADGCNLWRNWDDIDCNWNSLNSIIQHWGDYGATLVKFAGPGHVHDPDMLLIGAGERRLLCSHSCCHEHARRACGCAAACRFGARGG